jgi:hypothetical protein
MKIGPEEALIAEVKVIQFPFFPFQPLLDFLFRRLYVTTNTAQR